MVADIACFISVYFIYTLRHQLKSINLKVDLEISCTAVVVVVAEP